jgi:hypothetical protein
VQTERDAQIESAKSIIRNIHILSRAFDAAQRWEWIDRNPADSAKPPVTRREGPPLRPPT